MFNEYSPISSLINASREVLAKWENGDLAAAVRQLSEALQGVDQAIETSKKNLEIASSAREIYQEKCGYDDIEIDQLPAISIAEDGAFVSAWVWVPLENSDEESETDLREKLEAAYAKDTDSWVDLPFLPRSDWQEEVNNGDTSRGYWEWVESEVEQRKHDAEDAGFTVDEDSDQPGLFFFKSPEGNGSDISYATEEEAWCQAYLQL